MRILYAGFNGFDQFPSKNLNVEGFEKIDSAEKYLEVLLLWSYNIYLLESQTILAGFSKEQSVLETPNNLSCRLVSGNDRHVLFVNGDCDIWELKFGENERPNWRLLPCFISAETHEEKEKIVKISCGETMNIVLTDKGNVFDGPSKIVSSGECHGNVIDISCGHEHGILVTDKGNVYTWGSGRLCQLGHGDTDNRDRPELVNALGGLVIVKVAAGGWHCCALTRTGDLYTWGWNCKGQLGIREEAAHYSLPTIVDFDEDIVEVACGTKHTIAKTADGALWAAGWNYHRQLGLTDDTRDYSVFQYIRDGVKEYDLVCGPWSTALVSHT